MLSATRHEAETGQAAPSRSAHAAHSQSVCTCLILGKRGPPSAWTSPMYAYVTTSPIASVWPRLPPLEILNRLPFSTVDAHQLSRPLTRATSRASESYCVLTLSSERSFLSLPRHGAQGGAGLVRRGGGQSRINGRGGAPSGVVTARGAAQYEALAPKGLDASQQ